MSNLVFVRFIPKAGEEDQVERILRGMVINSRAEPGCLLYNLYDCQTLEGKRIFCLTERYKDADALQAHRDTDHYKAYRATIMDLLESPIEPHILNPLDANE